VESARKPKEMADEQHQQPFLKPMDIRHQGRFPYETVIRWIEVGHPRVGKLRAIDFSEPGKRRSYRIKPEDWEDFQQKLSCPEQTRQEHSSPPPRPHGNSKGGFDY
jgi:hypothetical protein